MKIVKQTNTTVTLNRDEVAKIIIKHIKDVENIDIERVSFNMNEHDSLVSVECNVSQTEKIK